MNLSEHFPLAEMTFSQTAVRKGIGNNPPPQAVVALEKLCENVLEPVRAHFGKPVRISSGYRSQALNKAVGGSGTSQHCFGEAADIVVPGVDNLRLAKWIEANTPFDQVIMEGGWVHVSFGPRNRRQALTAHFSGGRATYSQGL
jgi:zinc D-Ala-D-Ala carboxypeptidase